MRVTVVMIFTFFVSMSLQAADTELKLFRPFDNPQVSLIVRERHEGQCWQQSGHIKREDAWRCMADGKTYDPCFIQQYGSHKQALCPESPWNTSSVQLELPAAVDNTSHVPLDMSQAYPWGIELESGEKCLAIDDGKLFDGLPVRYECDNQTVIFGHMQRCKTQWSILQRNGIGMVATAIINKAWF